jgi:hypothetical protein
MLYEILKEIPDHRRAQWRQFWLAEILYFSILAIISWADSYRKIETFIRVHFKALMKKFKLDWKKVPWYCAIRKIIQWVNKEEFEKVFRKHSSKLSLIKEQNDKSGNDIKVVSIDWKAVKWSFDNFNDQKAIQILSALLNTEIILAHETINEKTNEIPVAQKFFEELGVKCHIFTLDALHCQKKLLKR